MMLQFNRLCFTFLCALCQCMCECVPRKQLCPKCPNHLCGSFFYIKSAHQDGQQFQCDLCDWNHITRFRQYSVLCNHLDKHHGDIEGVAEAIAFCDAAKTTRQNMEVMQSSAKSQPKSVCYGSVRMSMTQHCKTIYMLHTAVLLCDNCPKLYLASANALQEVVNDIRGNADIYCVIER